MKFDVNTGAFTAQFTVDTSVKAPSVVYLMEDIHYPNGYKLSLAVNDEET